MISDEVELPEFKSECEHKAGIYQYDEDGIIDEDEITEIYRCRYCDILFKFIMGRGGECVGYEEFE